MEAHTPTTVLADAYPVRLTGVRDAQLSRWLWLVKWILIIPHIIVLFFLWIAFAFLTIAAFFAILFTGRYPHGVFDFNVGVLRWSWRVTFYSYGVLGTDKYPPFSLAPDPGYPASLEVEYPEHLSRGKVLLKWWLFALPHYLLVSIFLGSSFQGRMGGDRWVTTTGLIELLVIFVAIMLLFVKRYPRGIFDLLMGMHRWIYRVYAYAGLMRDEYPPFRLDQGPTEPHSVTPAAPVTGTSPGP